ncbi:LacI family DNA-binding transcriptional regulator [Mameliella sediminis]|uniref:LacI family DNA-binding transcriptional regulator n=1 Tax=Mameliella sediminis TaxID=2836866 RepID=UPI001C459101|nr:substrate-binding domain-containing protein [Mameliella sediminis]MBY6114620.1 substrate-binding domain-containing protein [Antarctobacter heliothermus]MBY6144193.1 substrate-binding domain-containing protein [Mameliella alba]MBV7392899.1 substrate-binding domain-containing protein [Mameliella sediminis]MBY6161515.1 substrate-binding domain-containing protein [Mameliella alba]MBY6170019.1 substrate-binding domain-containing protein [Mameliella alba]
MNLKQLSEHLNLSQTTVSRALNGYPEVSEKTREKVLRAARELNYSPNARAKGLATGRAQAIGHVLPISDQHEMVNPIFGDFIAGAGKTYSKAGYEVMISLVDDKDEENAYRKIRSRGNVDGIIVHGPRMADTRIALLTELGLPFVVHGRASDVALPYSWLDTNNTRAFRRATDFLLDLGHRRIALVNGLEFMDFAHRRRKAYSAALADRHVPEDPALMRSGEMTEVYGYRSARDMLALDDRPTGFLVSSMITAIGVRRAIHEAGLEMGRDVSVITHDDDLGYLGNGHEVPIFTATRSSVRVAGMTAAELLLDLIRNPGQPPLTRLMEAELIIGSSTGPAPQR